MLRTLISAAIVAVAPFAVNASAIISDGNISLGVNDLGHLNVPGGTADIYGTTAVGLRWVEPGSGTEYESTSHGCLCEGWGLAVDGVSSGYANEASGTGGLTLDSFVSTATTATSVTQITGTDIFVTHHYALASGTDDLFQVDVKIENRGVTDVSTLKYRRTMDWDTSPTPFDEYVTIKGTGTTSLLAYSSDDGFSNSNPLLLAGGDREGCGVTTDFTACGPADHGAVFDFDFGALAAGEVYEFETFYGASANGDAARAALGVVGAELYSLGWSYLDPDGDGIGTGGETTPTFIFGFSGVGGTPVEPPAPIPVPASAWLLLSGLGIMAGARKRRKS